MSEFVQVEGRSVANIKLFTLSTCGWCRKTKAFLEENNIAYSYVDVDTLSQNEEEYITGEQLRYNPEGSFPTVVVDDDQVICGYDLPALQALIGA